MAEPIVAQSIGIPVRQHHHSATATRREPARVGEIVFGIGRFHGRGEPQEVGKFLLISFLMMAGIPVAGGKAFDRTPFQPKICGSGVAEKFIALGDDALIQPANKSFNRLGTLWM